MDHYGHCHFPCTVYDPDALRDHCMTRCCPVWYWMPCLPVYPPVKPCRPVRPPRPEPKHCPEPWKKEITLSFCFPEHREICSVDVRLLRLQHCRDGSVQAIFRVSVDYVDCSGCKRWETFSCRENLCLPCSCDDLIIAPDPAFSWHCGELSLKLCLTCR